MGSYTDKTSIKLIFFSKKTFELSFDVSSDITEFISLLSNLNEDSCKLFIDFKKWLDNEKTSSHIDEKKSKKTLVLSWLSARIVQHEIDHLNGVMFYDHINKENPFDVPAEYEKL